MEKKPPPIGVVDKYIKFVPLFAAFFRPFVRIYVHNLHNLHTYLHILKTYIHQFDSPPYLFIKTQGYGAPQKTNKGESIYLTCLSFVHPCNSALKLLSFRIPSHISLPFTLPRQYYPPESNRIESSASHLNQIFRFVSFRFILCFACRTSYVFSSVAVAVAE